MPTKYNMMTDPSNPRNREDWTLYSNQFTSSYLTKQLPKTVYQMYKWAELLFYNCPPIANGIRKLCSYPLTDFIYLSEAEEVKKESKEFLEVDLDLKAEVLKTALDRYVYGNAFRSVHFPFKRFLICPCGNKIAIDHAQYSCVKAVFKLNCGVCKQKKVAKIEDIYLEDPTKIKVVSWSPHQVSLLSNPVTGETTYYYEMDKATIAAIQKGESVIVSKLPEVFLNAFKQKKKIKFNENFYHLKVDTLSGFSSGFGTSQLNSAFKIFLQNAVLRRSSEAIAMEHITPKNILFPQGTSTDPTIGSSMRTWRKHLTTATHKWRRDPNYLALAPYPTGIVNLGSQGKGMSPYQEILQSDKDMLLALNIPLDFVYGQMKIDASSIALRVLENELTPMVKQLKHFSNWVIRSVNAKYNRNFSKVDFTPFPLVDDMVNKQLLLNLSMNDKGVSQSTMQAAMKLDPLEEREKIIEDAVNKFKDMKKVEFLKTKEEESIAAKAQADMIAQQTDSVPQYDQQKLVAAAQAKAQEFLQVPLEERRSYMDQLSKEDYVMYALVRAQMDSMKNASNQTGAH